MTDEQDNKPMADQQVQENLPQSGGANAPAAQLADAVSFSEEGAGTILAADQAAALSAVLATAHEDVAKLKEMIKTTEQELAAVKEGSVAAAEIASIASELRKKAKGARAKYEQIDHAAQSVAEALGEIEANKSKVTEFASTIETHSSRSTELSAKVAEQASRVEQLKSEAETHTASAKESADSAQSIASEAESLTELAAEARTHCENIEDGKNYVGKARSKIEEAASDIGELVRAAEQAVSRSTEMRDSISALDEEVQEFHVDSKSATETCTTLAAKAEEIEQRISGYEGELVRLQEESSNQLATIEGLLPGATSTGLAAAFRERREKFQLPQIIWQGVFLFSVLGLLAVAALSFGVLGNLAEAKTAQELGFALLHRVPFIIPLVWLAVHALRQAGQAKRLEEDYAFKEVMSRSFEGYRREMAAVGQEVPSGSPVLSLCELVLKAISTPPGRLYDAKYNEATPMSILTDALNQSERDTKSESDPPVS